VNRPLIRFDIAREALNRFRIGKIEANEAYGGTAPGQLVGNLPAKILQHIGQHKACAVVRASDGDGAPDSARSARDDYRSI
jgi:hypothetical protein